MSRTTARSATRRPAPSFRPVRGLIRNQVASSLFLLALLLGVLCVAGGASRAGEMGQLIVRLAAIAAMMLLCVTRRTWSLGGATVPFAAVGLVALVGVVQLIPLPPAVWTLLPGRSAFVAAMPSGAQPWRPINLSPDGGLNAVLSLTVPLAVIALLAGVPRARGPVVANIVLATIIFSALIGSLQLSGLAFDNPLINETVGEAAGIFANRNHQALFMACGLPLLARWAFPGGHRRIQRGRIAAAIGLTLWLLLLILATGSRAGLGLALLGLGIAAALAVRQLRNAAVRLSRWALPAMLAAAVGAIAIVVLIGLNSDRALSLQRLTDASGPRDIRLSSLPLLWSLAVRYFPFGSGLGTFDPMFRIIEPFELLAPTYLNHAHNDAIEIVIETGLAGLIFIAIALWLWVRTGLHNWRTGGRGDLTAVVGWAVLTLVLIASLVDYPLRTPMIMSLAAIAAWLSRSDREDGRTVRDEDRPT